jgi:TPR repeat protein
MALSLLWATVFALLNVPLWLALGPPTLAFLASATGEYLDWQESKRGRDEIVSRNLELWNPHRGLPLVSDVSAFEAGASAPMGAHLPASAGQTYVPRESQATTPREEFDSLARRALVELRFVLAIGPADVGKSRSLFEAIRHALGDRRLVIPRYRESIDALLRVRPSMDLARSVVWLDDLESFLGPEPDSFSTWHLDQLLAKGCVVAATMRSDIYERYERSGDLARPIKTLLERAHPVFRLRPLTDPGRVSQCFPGAPPEFLASVERFGLGAALVSGPVLIDRLEGGVDPAGVAVVRAAIDWQRVGMRRPLTKDMLQRLGILYLKHHELGDADWDRAFDWAREPLLASLPLALLLSVAPGPPATYAAHYSLAEHFEGQDAPIPQDVWVVALSQADTNERGIVALSAYMRAQSGRPDSLDLVDFAEGAWKVDAEAGELWAINNMGTLAFDRANLTEAESWFRQGAVFADPYAMTMLGTIRNIQGDTLGAEDWLRRAAVLGAVDGMAQLGLLLARQDRPEADTWLRKASLAGDPQAMTVLGIRLARQDNLAEATEWLTRAADTGDHHAMAHLGMLLVQEADAEGALAWLRKSAAGGHPEGKGALGTFLLGLGEMPEGEKELREAANLQDKAAMLQYARLLLFGGRVAEAERWFRKAARRDDPHAMTSLGNLLAARGQLPQAEVWLRRAAGRDPAAASALGAVLWRRGRQAEAETWLKKAAKEGEPAAMVDLALAHWNVGATEQSERWARSAAKTGYLPSMTFLGTLLTATNRSEEGEEWLNRSIRLGDASALLVLAREQVRQRRYSEATSLLRATARKGNSEAAAILSSIGALTDHDRMARKWAKTSAQAGSPEGMTMYGLRHQWAGDEASAEYWFRRAVDLGHPHGLTHLGMLLLDRGDIEAGRELLKDAAETRDPEAMRNYGISLARLDHGPSALAWLQRATEGNDLPAAAILGALLFAKGERKRARVILKQAGDAGSDAARLNYAVMLDHEGDPQGAEEGYRHSLKQALRRPFVGVRITGLRVGSVSAEAAFNLGTILRRRGRWMGDTWQQAASDAGMYQAMLACAVDLDRKGKARKAARLRSEADLARRRTVVRSMPSDGQLATEPAWYMGDGMKRSSKRRTVPE